ncbi:hypothetical protein LZ575_02435 [Antarcticibacterium sp. 1MA-6-2]|uniref:hypothetical protein n=1 Tax=Antarcticibacterium sp. 1MA-6-2 TaxID=2908210 RepID=UPI001F2E2C51|nr:hypothetical protein [Antarcticibacterium sp. 1MA-6-2]UJH91591.1 hypothetical protein LZ575_02435 [Antarcticibacterium sp. 1MA-6-2]
MMLHYIFYSIAALGITYTLYRLLLKTEKCYIFNRSFLLATLILCLLAPTLNLDWGHSMRLKNIQLNEIVRMPDIPEENPQITTVQVVEKKDYSPFIILKAFYFFVCCLLIFRFVRNLWIIKKLISSGEEKAIENFKVIEIEEKGNPFSFFNFLFINTEDLTNQSYARTIFSHRRCA